MIITDIHTESCFNLEIFGESTFADIEVIIKKSLKEAVIISLEAERIHYKGELNSIIYKAKVNHILSFQEH